MSSEDEYVPSNSDEPESSDEEDADQEAKNVGWKKLPKKSAGKSQFTMACNQEVNIDLHEPG